MILPMPLVAGLESFAAKRSIAAVGRFIDEA